MARVYHKARIRGIVLGFITWITCVSVIPLTIFCVAHGFTEGGAYKAQSKITIVVFGTIRFIVDKVRLTIIVGLHPFIEHTTNAHIFRTLLHVVTSSVTRRVDVAQMRRKHGVHGVGIRNLPFQSGERGGTGH